MQSRSQSQHPFSKLIESGVLLICFILFAIFLLAPAVYVFKGSFENISVSLVASESGFTLQKLH